MFAAEPQSPESGVDVAAEFGARRCGSGRQRPHDQRATGTYGSQPVTHDVTKAADDPVANHRVAHRLADHEADPGCRAGVSQCRIDFTRAETRDLLGRDGMHDEPGTPSAAPLPGHEPKVVATGQSTGRGEQTQADRLLRPLRRRAARIARPARVRMRRRNPWVRARRRLFGWKVRLLTAGSPGYWLVKSTLSPSRPDGAQDSPTTDGRPSQGTHPGQDQRTRGCVGAARRHAAHTQCLLPNMPCGMAQRLLACVLLVGQSGVGARCAAEVTAGPPAGSAAVRRTFVHSCGQLVDAARTRVASATAEGSQ